MAGYGNKTGSFTADEDYNPRLNISHSGAYSGATEHGSGTTSGAGYGNKKGSHTVDDEYNPRFDLHRNSDAYSGENEFGSGTTGGAGWGNKTGSHGESSDSAMGKLVQKAGTMMHNEKMVEKGVKMREERGFVGGAGGGGEIQGGINGEGARKWDE